MKAVFLHFIFLLLCYSAFTQENVQSVTIPSLGWTLRLPANADMYQVDLFNKIGKSAQNIRQIPDQFIDPDGKTTSSFINTAVIYSNYDDKECLINIDYGTINSSRTPNLGWSAFFEDDVKSITSGTKFGLERGGWLKVDTATSFETIDNNFFTVFKDTVTYKPGVPLPTQKIYKFYTNRDGNKFLKISITYTDDKKGNDVIELIKNSAFTPISSEGQMPFISSKLKINDELKALSFVGKSGDEREDRVFMRSFGVSFAGTEADWKQLLRCGLQKSVLEKNHVVGKKLQVIVQFILQKDGQPCQLTVVSFPEECPDCAIEALKLFYKHIQPGSGDKCNVVTTKEPYRQWIAGEVGARKVNSYVRVIVPFGYEDQKQDINFGNGHSTENIQKDKNADDDNNSNGLIGKRRHFISFH